MLSVLLPAKAGILLPGDDQFRFARFNLRRKIIASAGIESEVLLVSVSRRWAFAMNSCGL
jgi:hypothetical protein